MPNNTISQVKVNGTTYDICDAPNRDATSDLETRVTSLENSVVWRVGTHSLYGMMFPTYISGSGNYLEVAVPIQLESNVSSTAFSGTIEINCIAGGQTIGTDKFDTTHARLEAKGTNGFLLELKFRNTQTQYLPGMVRFGNKTTLVLLLTQYSVGNILKVSSTEYLSFSWGRVDNVPTLTFYVGNQSGSLREKIISISVSPYPRKI